MPQVHKLKEGARQNTENLLTGRPIVTGYGWCTTEASTFLQKRPRLILCRFKNYLSDNGLPNSILGNNNELIEVIKQTPIRSLEGLVFVCFDFKDLYTNMLIGDASCILRELASSLEIGQLEIDLLLDLYKFCNDWNYFNVGTSLYKQVKGVSMGCYFSKEISDLVLLYSEYKYFF